jgi:hypothetical protein
MPYSRTVHPQSRNGNITEISQPAHHVGRWGCANRANTRRITLDSPFRFQRIRNPTPSHEGDHFPKIQTGSWFLGLRWLDTALDFPHRRALFPTKAPSSRSTPRQPQCKKNVLGNCTTWARELTENLLLPFLRAFASSRETLPQGLPSDVQPMSVGFHPDTSASAFQPKSPFAFTLQVKPGKLHDASHWPLGSASRDIQPFIICGL